MRGLLDRQPHWSGTASQLLELLQPIETPSPRGLSQELSYAAPTLAAAGIEVQFRRSHGVRFIDLSRKPGAANLPQALPGPVATMQPDETKDLLAA